LIVAKIKTKVEGTGGAQESRFYGHRSTQVTNKTKDSQLAVSAHITPLPLNAIATDR
jgi:hypothetical protein